jgi:glutamate racemase
MSGPDSHLRFGVSGLSVTAKCAPLPAADLAYIADDAGFPTWHWDEQALSDPSSLMGDLIGAQPVSWLLRTASALACRRSVRVSGAVCRNGAAISRRSGRGRG